MSYLDETRLERLWGKIKTYVNNAIASIPVPVDYVVEQGTSGIWIYEKWASGKAVAYMPEFYEYSNLKMTASGNLYLSEERYANLPSGLFVDTKYIVSHEFQSASGAVTILRQSTSTKDQYRFKICKVFSTATGVAVKFRVEGRW